MTFLVLFYGFLPLFTVWHVMYNIYGPFRYEKSLFQNEKFLHDTFILSSYFHTHPITLLLEILRDGCMGRPHLKCFGGRLQSPVSLPHVEMSKCGVTMADLLKHSGRLIQLYGKGIFLISFVALSLSLLPSSSIFWSAKPFVPHVRTSMAQSRSFASIGPSLWNKLSMQSAPPSTLVVDPHPSLNWKPLTSSRVKRIGRASERLMRRKVPYKWTITTQGQYSHQRQGSKTVKIIIWATTCSQICQKRDMEKLKKVQKKRSYKMEI